MIGWNDSRYLNAHWLNAPIGVCWVSTEGLFLEVNQAMCNIVGFTEYELKQKKWTDITHPEDIDPDKSEVDNLIHRHKSFYTLTKRYITKNSKVVWVKITVYPIRKENNTIEHFVVWVDPLPNGGKFVVEKETDGTLVVRPSVNWWQFIIENWKFSAFFLVLLILSIGEKLAENLQKLLKLF